MPTTAVTKEQWLHFIDVQQSSGLTIKQFCLNHHLSEAGFYKAKARFKAQMEQDETKVTQVIQNEFIAIESTTTQTQPTTSKIEVSIAGANISLPGGTSPQWLADFIKGVRS